MAAPLPFLSVQVVSKGASDLEQAGDKVHGPNTAIDISLSVNYKIGKIGWVGDDGLILWRHGPDVAP
jgi:hypothetical protein